MVHSSAKTVTDYLDELPPNRRAIVASVRQVIVEHLPDGYEEVMNWGMICYELPLSRYPNTYNKKPLMFAGLAAQKNHYGLYLSCLYCHAPSEQTFREKFAETGKKLDMGKSCIRFKKLNDLPLDLVSETIAAMPVAKYIEYYEQVRSK